MDIRKALGDVRLDLQRMDTDSLAQLVRDIGEDPSGLTRIEMIDILMSIEEHAAFH